MSYSFDGVNDRIKGSFTSTYATPVTIALFIKVTAHPLAASVIMSFGNSSSSNNDSLDLRTSATDDIWGFRSTTAAAGASTALETELIDGVWTPIVGVLVSDAERTIYIKNITQTATDTASRVLGTALQHIQIGENLANAADFTGLLAEVAIWDVALSTADITSYLGATAASSIDATNLIGYWPLSASNATQSNIGTDAGGDLTVTSAVFDADHPTITGGAVLAPIRLIWRV